MKHDRAEIIKVITAIAEAHRPQRSPLLQRRPLGWPWLPVGTLLTFADLWRRWPNPWFLVLGSVAVFAIVMSWISDEGNRQ